MRVLPKRIGIGPVLLGLVLLASPAAAEEGLITLYASAFNQLPAAVGPSRPTELAPLFEPPDGVIKVYNSTFNELAAAVEPIEFKSPENGPRRPVSVFGFGCAGNWKAKVSKINFNITTSKVDIDGKVKATWTCGVSFDFSGAFNTTANVSYTATHNEIRVTLDPVGVELKWDAPLIGQLIKVRRTIDPAEGLKIPPIPVKTTSFHFETARGVERLRLSPHNIALVKRNGYIEVHGDVTLW